MRLSVEGKTNLLDSAKKVYLAYTALDFFKEKKFSTSGGQFSLNELCQKAIAENTLDQFLVIDEANYQLTLTPKPEHTYDVQFERVLSYAEKHELKEITAYSNKEALALLAHKDQQFSIGLSVSGASSVVSNKINEQYVIGGKRKVDLYRTHLVTLYNIIEKISREDDISNLLVALATGSGKTFVQALWILVLSMSGNNGIFAIPDKLVLQFVKDLRDLLPDSFVDKIDKLRDEGNNLGIDELINSLAEQSTRGKIIVGSTECLIDRYYQQLLDADSQHTFLAFDEQHLIMKEERRRIRLIELSKQKLSMFLTATPNKETYELCGHKPVAIMSSGQKQKAGQGQFPQLITHQARNISDRNKLKNYRFWTSAFWQNIANGILLRLTSAIQEEYSSAAVSLVEDLPFYLQEKEDEKNPRWRIQAPATRKILCIVDDNETLVNLCHALEADKRRRDVYRNGNVVNRSDVADFFNIPDAETDIIREDMSDKRIKHQDLMQKKGVNHKTYQHGSLKERLTFNIFHGLVEYLLVDLTGLNEIEHNRLRKQDMNAFVDLVIQKFQSKGVDYYQEKLTAVIGSEGAKEVSFLLADLSTFFNDKQNDREAITAFIDNWSLNDGLIAACYGDFGSRRKNFFNYANKYCMIGIMSGMHKAETPVKESKPFAGLESECYPLYDSDGALQDKVKKRKHTSLEILSDTSYETAFTPRYLDLSEEQADAYFRLGFTGMYVSNKKTEGFSDRNLHTVINLAEHTLSTTNSPETQIQGIGRNRGLDETVMPAYIHSLGRRQETVFNLEHLQRADYYPELFKAQKSYSKKFVKVLGGQVSQQIIAWIHANLDKDETIHPDRLKRQVLKFIAQALRNINNKNSHHIKLSRLELTKIVGYAMGNVDKEIAHIKKPYSLSYFIKGLGFLLNFISEIYYTFKRIPVALKMSYYKWFGTRSQAPSVAGGKHPDDVYMKVIQKTSFKDIISQLGALREFKNWLITKREGIKTHVGKNIGNYLKQDIMDAYSTHQQHFLIPLLMKLVIEEKQDQVAHAVASFPQFMSFLQANLPLLDDFFSNKSVNFTQDVLGFLQQIPGLQDLTAADLVNYPKKMAEIQQVVEGAPKDILGHYPELQRTMATQLTAFLKNNFSQSVSAFISYPQAKKLQNILNKDNNAQCFVDHCMSKLIAGKLEFTPESILQELNNFFPAIKLTTLEDDVKSLLKKKDDLLEATNLASSHVINTLFSQGRWLALGNELLPLLASYIKEDSKKEQFLAVPPTLLAMHQFISAYGPQMSVMLQEEGEPLKKNALTLINQFFPEGAKLVVEDIVLPVDHALTTASKMDKEMKKALGSAFLTSSTFCDLMKNALNRQDYQLLMTSLNTPEKIERLADAIVTIDGSLNKEALLDVIKASDPDLKAIDLLDNRLGSFRNFIDEMQYHGEKNLDHNKMEKIISDSMALVLFNKQFIGTLDKLIGFLDQHDLIVLFDALEKKHPAEEAKQLMSFLRLIRAGDKEGLMRQFMIASDVEKDFDFENIPLKNTIESLEKIISEVLDIHCDYNNHDRKGLIRYGVKPKLSAKISQELKDMTIPADDSFFNGFSRKIFYIQGIRRGLDKASEVSAASNQHLVKILERVKNHILRPLWWGTNLSKTTHLFIKGCRNVVYGVRAGYYSVVNSIKSLLNWIAGRSYFIISTRNPDSKDYHETAHDFAEKINELEPLAARHVQKAECRRDVIVHLEEYVDVRPFRAGFFGNLGVPESGENDNKRSFTF